MFSGGILSKIPPAATNIKDTHARGELGEASNSGEFCFLSLIERRRLRPEPAGIGHAGIKHRLEEIVAEIVMVFTNNKNPGTSLRVMEKFSGQVQKKRRVKFMLLVLLALKQFR